MSSLLEELRERGVQTDVPTLFVLDGAKALRSAVGRVWGKFAVVQRCQAHKKRNVEAHLPDKHHDELRRQLNLAYHHTKEQARTLVKVNNDLAATLNPDAAASLQEGWRRR